MENFKLPVITGAALVMAVLAGCASLTLTGIEQDTVSGPNQVRQGQDINPRDITIYGSYKDGSRRTVSVSAGNITFNKDAVGPQTVRVKVGNYEASFQTEVMALTGIRIDRPPAKLEYMQGESLSLNGLRLIGEWEGMSEAEIAVAVNDISGYNRSAPGNQTVTITKSGKTAAFEVTVTESPFDLALNGRWVYDAFGFVVIYTFNNGDYEYHYGEGTASRGTYTTDGDTLTLTMTHWYDDDSWYTLAEIFAIYPALEGFIIPVSTLTYSVNGSRLNLDKTDYTKR